MKYVSVFIPHVAGFSTATTAKPIVTNSDRRSITKRPRSVSSDQTEPAAKRTYTPEDYQIKELKCFTNAHNLVKEAQIGICGSIITNPYPLSDDQIATATKILTDMESKFRNKPMEPGK